MIIYKSKAEIDLMREAGSILAEALQRLQDMAAPGITLDHPPSQAIPER